MSVNKASVAIHFAVFLCLLCRLTLTDAKKSEEKEKPAWAKKDIRDYTDADLERLLDQWDVSYMLLYLRFFHF